MYLVVLCVIAISLSSTSAFNEFCDKNITLNRHVRMSTNGVVTNKLLIDGVCRFIVRPSKKDMLMAVRVDIPPEKATEMCKLIRFTHREKTYDFCHIENIPAMDQEVIVEITDGDFYMQEHEVTLMMTVFYPAQCHVHEGMCEWQADADSCDAIHMRRLELWGDQASIMCTDQQARDCPHRCDVCSERTAGSCCFSGGVQRDGVADGTMLSDGSSMSAMGICNSHPYGCNDQQCDESCEVGKANGPYCVSVTRDVPLYGAGVGEYGGGMGEYGGGMGEHGWGMGVHGGGLFGGLGNHGEGVDDEGVDGDDGRDKTKSEANSGNEVDGKWPVAVGIILVLAA